MCLVQNSSQNQQTKAEIRESVITMYYLYLLTVFLVVTQCNGFRPNTTETKQVWDYVEVRDNANMFWWLYYTTNQTGYDKAPLVLWLQGGPGASSTGFGNFQEIGPLDVNLNPRETTWLSAVSLLFVDNPVGTGFSYVTDDKAYSRDSHQIAVDLVSVMKAFMEKLSDFESVPFYIFSESYGGKMTAAFSQQLYKAIHDGHIKCNFQGFAMGDSWISPLDSVLTWGPYLYATSLADGIGLATIDKSARKIEDAIKQGKWAQSTVYWSDLEAVVENVTKGVNFYNILKWGEDEYHNQVYHGMNTYKRSLGQLFNRHVRVYQNDALASLMNGPIRDKLKIIPKNITWGGQSSMVFEQLSGDFMKPVTDIVDDMLNTPVKVVVYSGQLDLICDTMGTEMWVKGLNWDHLEDYNKSPRSQFFTSDHGVAGFVKQYKNFSFYWVLNAGHMVPADAGEAALKLLHLVTA